LPVGVIEQNQPYPIETDHLGTPRVVADSKNDVVLWRWDIVAGDSTHGGSNAFGDQPPNEDVDGDGKLYNLEMRFPGQLHDSETGLHYNYFRDYEPGTGRYVESDPIGLAGGMSTYGYVDNNVLGFSDPEGLLRVRAGEMRDGSGNYYWNFWFDFSSCEMAAGKEAVSKLTKVGRAFDRLGALNSGAGDNDIDDYMLWCRCLQSDPDMKRVYEGLGYTPGGLAAGSSQLSENRAREVVDLLRTTHSNYVEKNCKSDDCAKVRNAYKWDGLVDRAIANGTKHPRRMMEWFE